MKSFNLLIASIAFVLIISFQSYGQISEREYLRYIITFADDYESKKNAKKMALERPDLLVEIILLPKTETGNLTNRFARQNAFVYLLQCSQQRTVTPVKFFQTAFKLMKHISLYVYESDLADEKERYINLITTYGYNPISRKASIDLSDNLQAFLLSLDCMHSLGFISSVDVFEKLKQKTATAIRVFNNQNKDIDKLCIELENVLEILKYSDNSSFGEEGFTITQGFLQNLIIRIKNKDY